MAARKDSMSARFTTRKGIFKHRFKGANENDYTDSREECVLYGYKGYGYNSRRVQGHKSK